MSNPGPVTAPGTGRIEPAPAAPPPVPPRPPTANGAPAGEPDDPWAGHLPSMPAGLDLTNLLPERNPEHIMAGEIYVHFGRSPMQTYILPVLSIAENRRWKAKLEGGLVAILSHLDDLNDLGRVIAAFDTVSPQLLDALIEYDVEHVLPERAALEGMATDPQVLRAVLEVWSAANPFARVAVAALRAAQAQVPDQATTDQPANGSSTPTNTARQPTGGRRATSKRK